MALSFVAVATGTSDSNGSSIAAGALNVAAGDLLVGYVRYDVGTTPVITMSDGGSNVFTIDGPTEQGGLVGGCFGWKINAAASASCVITALFSQDASYFRFYVLQFRPTADTESLEPAAGNPVWGNGQSTAALTGNMSPSGSDLVCIGAVSCYGQDVFSAEQINDTVDDATQSSIAYAETFYSILGEGFTDGHAQATLGSSDHWVCGLISFKSVSAGGVSVPAIEHSVGRGVRTGISRGIL